MVWIFDGSLSMSNMVCELLLMASRWWTIFEKNKTKNTVHCLASAMTHERSIWPCMYIIKQKVGESTQSEFWALKASVSGGGCFPYKQVFYIKEFIYSPNQTVYCVKLKQDMLTEFPYTSFMQICYLTQKKLFQNLGIQNIVLVLYYLPSFGVLVYWCI